MLRDETARLLTALFILVVGFYTLGSVVRITRQGDSTLTTGYRLSPDVDEVAGADFSR